MDISIVIPSFNEQRYIAEALESVLNQEYSGSFEVIVSDNGSTDNTRSIVSEWQVNHPNLLLVDASQRRGAAYARNKAVQEASGRGVLFVDADDQVIPGWLQSMGDALSKHELIACGFDTKTLNESWQTDSWVNGQEGRLNDFDPPFLPWSGAGALGVLRDTFLHVGGFDGKFLCLEDADFCWRVQLTGIEMHFVDSTRICYRFPKKYSQIFKQERRIGQYHALLYRRYLARGMPRIQDPLPKAYHRWRRNLRKARRAQTRTQVASAIRSVGSNIGRIYGSIRYRVLDP